MPVGEVWWLNVDRYTDTINLSNQVLAAQAGNSKIAALVMRDEPNNIISLDNEGGPDNITLSTLPNHSETPEEVHRNLICSLKPGNYLFILLCTENTWQNVNKDRLCAWVEKTSRWA